MKSIPFALSALALGLAAGPAMAVDDSDGKMLLDARWRLESVDDDAFARDAFANTLRIRLGYQSPVRGGWSGVIEGEATQHLFGEDFNSSANGQIQFPSVVDPDNSELNQAYVRYAPGTKTQFTLGRQRVQWDNQRFFGNVGWRQNEQTFDALDIQHSFGNGIKLRYDYLDRALRINGADNPNENLARYLLNGHLLSIGHALGPGNLSGYAHLIENETLPLSSHRNLGLRYTAKKDAPDGIGWLAAIEYAKQDTYADGADKIDADYFLLEGGVVWKASTFKAGWEQLGGDGSYGFATPFATLHAFNGWADKFLTTPVNGLNDAYLGWNRRFGKLGAALVWHDFSSDTASIHYGQEWNASLGYVFDKHWNGLIKLADYSADDIGTDTTKLWLSMEYIY
jgi:Alginate export